MLKTLATWEAEVEKILLPGQFMQTDSETPSGGGAVFLLPPLLEQAFFLAPGYY
jgi:hypothetical protein